MEDKIDIIVTYVDNNEPHWKREFHDWRIEEINDGNKDLSDNDLTGESRYRSWDNFQYFFRGIEKNCLWFNKLFLVVADEKQLPPWLDKNNPRLRIVYHKEYIPEEFLPTFNSNVIEMFFHKIADLSDHYILFNDDIFVTKKINEDMFFKDGKPVFNGRVCKWKKFPSDSLYRHTLNNNIDFEIPYFKKAKKEQVAFSHAHVASPHVKSFEKKLWEDNHDKIWNSLAVSRFRNRKNLTHFIYGDILQIMNKAFIRADVYNRAICVNVRDYTEFSNYRTYSMVCFNDSGSLRDFDTMKKRELDFLDMQLPQKSGFEKFSVYKSTDRSTKDIIFF